MVQDPASTGAIVTAPEYSQKQPLSRAELMRAMEMPWSPVDWRRLIASDRDKINAGRNPASPNCHHEHRYRGGPPVRRIKKMQLAHEARARKLGIDWDTIDLRDVYAFHGGVCGICREGVELGEFTVDHVVPVSRGGPHLFHNLQPAHAACNSLKGDG